MTDWTAFDAAASRDADARIVDQFTADPDRLSRMTVEAARPVRTAYAQPYGCSIKYPEEA